jgi:hypothetical protein
MMGRFSISCSSQKVLRNTWMIPPTDRCEVRLIYPEKWRTLCAQLPMLLCRMERWTMNGHTIFGQEQLGHVVDVVGKSI